MADNERYSPDSQPGEHPHIPPEVIEAFKDSPFDVNQFYNEIKDTDGKMLLALEAIAERFRKSDTESAEFKRGVLIGILATIKMYDIKEGSEWLKGLFNQSAHIDEQHSPVDPPLSA